jgi:hypothetical protein
LREKVRLVRLHRANDGKFIGHFGHFRPVFGELDASELRLDRLRRTLVLAADLRIERFELAWSAIHPQQNHPLAALAQFFRVRDHHVAPT